MWVPWHAFSFRESWWFLRPSLILLRRPVRPPADTRLFHYPGIPSLTVVPISFSEFNHLLRFLSHTESTMISSGAPASFANRFTSYSTSDFVFVGTTYTNLLLVTKSWQQMWPLEDFSLFFVSTKLSMKKCYFIYLYRNILPLLL